MTAMVCSPSSVFEPAYASNHMFAHNNIMCKLLVEYSSIRMHRFFNTSAVVENIIMIITLISDTIFHENSQNTCYSPQLFMTIREILHQPGQFK